MLFMNQHQILNSVGVKAGFRPTNNIDKMIDFHTKHNDKIGLYNSINMAINPIMH